MPRASLAVVRVSWLQLQPWVQVRDHFSIHLGRRQYVWLVIFSTLALGIGWPGWGWEIPWFFHYRRPAIYSNSECLKEWQQQARLISVGTGQWYLRRQWHPTPVLLPGKSHGRRSLVGCSPWDHEESDNVRLPGLTPWQAAQTVSPEMVRFPKPIRLPGASQSTCAQ